MPKFKVYFQIYGKKMVATVDAATAKEARLMILEKLQIDLVEKLEEQKPPSDEDMLQGLKDIFGF